MCRAKRGITAERKSHRAAETRCLPVPMFGRLYPHTVHIKVCKEARGSSDLCPTAIYDLAFKVSTLEASGHMTKTDDHVITYACQNKCLVRKVVYLYK